MKIVLDWFILIMALSSMGGIVGSGLYLLECYVKDDLNPRSGTIGMVVSFIIAIISCVVMVNYPYLIKILNI